MPTRAEVKRSHADPSPGRIDEVWSDLAEKTEYYTIMTRTQYDELICRPQQQFLQSPLPSMVAQSQAAPSAIQWVNPRDMVNQYLVTPLTSSNTAVPLITGAKDGYTRVYRPSTQMHGLLGTKMREFTYNGKSYIALEGERAQRQILSGTNYYHSDDPKILQMAFGKKGMSSEIRGGLKTALYIGVGLEVARWFFDRHYTFSQLLGGIVAEVGKAALTTAIAGFFGSLAGLLFGAFAFVPLATFVVIGVLAGIGVNYVDSKFGLKVNLQAGFAAALEWMDETTGSAGDWTEQQYNELRHHANEVAKRFREGLSTAIERSDRSLEAAIERGSDHPIASYQEIRARSLQNSGLRAIRALTDF